MRWWWGGYVNLARDLLRWYQTCELGIKRGARVEGGKKKHFLGLLLELTWKLELPLLVLRRAGKVCHIFLYFLSLI